MIYFAMKDKETGDTLIILKGDDYKGYFVIRDLEIEAIKKSSLTKVIRDWVKEHDNH